MFENVIVFEQRYQELNQKLRTLPYWRIQVCIVIS